MSSSEISKSLKYIASDGSGNETYKSINIKDLDIIRAPISDLPPTVKEDMPVSTSVSGVEAIGLSQHIENWYAANPTQAAKRPATIEYAKRAIAIATDRRRVENAELRIWRDLETYVQHLRRLEALKAEGPCFAVTLLIDADIIARAEGKQDPFDWLVDRIRYHLNSTLKRKIDWLLFDQQNDAEKLHLHGLLAISEQEIPFAKKALYRALGDCDWPFTEQFWFTQSVHRGWPNAGWLNYCREGQTSSNRYASTLSLTRKAKKHHEELRTLSRKKAALKTFMVSNLVIALNRSRSVRA